MDQLIPNQLPEPDSGVWPPAPTNQAKSSQSLTFPFKTLFLYVKPSSVPTFRQGTLTLSPEGVSIQGKAVTRYEIQLPILAATFFLRLFLLVYLLLEYAIRHDEFLNVPWADVRGATLVPKKRRVCLVYDAPNYKGVIKTFSLAFRPDPAYYDTLVGSLQTFLPGRVLEGKLRAWTSPPVWVFCAGLLLVLVVIGIVFAVSPQTLGNLR